MSLYPIEGSPPKVEFPSVTTYFIELPSNPAIPLLGIYMKNMKTLTCTPTFAAALFTIAKIWKQPSVLPWIKRWLIYHVFFIHLYVMEYYSATKSALLLSVTTRWILRVLC